jgi:hypothetical protein
VYDDALIRPWFESAVECVPGLSLFDASDVTPRAAEIRRLSTIFPTVDMTAAASTGDNGAGRSEVRGSSLPDHMTVDHLGPSAHALGAEDRRD